MLFAAFKETRRLSFYRNKIKPPSHELDLNQYLPYRLTSPLVDRDTLPPTLPNKSYPSLLLSKYSCIFFASLSAGIVEIDSSVPASLLLKSPQKDSKRARNQWNIASLALSSRFFIHSFLLTIPRRFFPSFLFFFINKKFIKLNEPYLQN